MVELGPTDHDRLAPWETQLTNTLAEMVQEHVDDEGWSTFGDIEVALSRNEELGTGMFNVSSSVDPNAGPRRRPYNSLSMPAVAAGGALPPPGGAPTVSIAAPVQKLGSDPIFSAEVGSDPNFSAAGQALADLQTQAAAAR